MKTQTKATLRDKAEARAKELGVTLEIAGGRYMELLVEAPAGKVFAGSQLHEVVLEKNPWAGNVWKAAIEEMEMGLESCADKGCDWCESNITNCNCECHEHGGFACSACADDHHTTAERGSK